MSEMNDQIAEAAAQPSDVAPSSAEAELNPGVAPISNTAAGEAPNAVSGAASDTSGRGSAESADGAATSSPTDANSAAEPKTFEQRVEERFLQIEHFLMKMPHSIVHAIHQGSASAEEVAARAIKHLFGAE